MASRDMFVLAVVLFPGVAAFVGFAQVGDVEPGVVVEGLEAGVAEELLDVVEVGVALDHLGGAAAPEGVRGDVDIKAECD